MRIPIVCLFGCCASAVRGVVSTAPPSAARKVLRSMPAVLRLIALAGSCARKRRGVNRATTGLQVFSVVHCRNLRSRSADLSCLLDANRRGGITRLAFPQEKLGSLEQTT